MSMRRKKSLSILNSVNVKSPCHESWEAMTGSKITRHCDKCDQAVNNLSEMTADQAARLLEKYQGKHICVRYSLNDTGGIRFKSRFPWADSAWRSVSLFLATGLTLLGISSLASADCTDTSKEKTSCDSRETIGEIAPARGTQSTAPRRDNEPVIMGGMPPRDTTPAPAQPTPVPGERVRK